MQPIEELRATLAHAVSPHAPASIVTTKRPGFSAGPFLMRMGLRLEVDENIGDNAVGLDIAVKGAFVGQAELYGLEPGVKAKA